MQVLDVLADVETRINGLLQSVDGLIDLVDYPSISAVYLQVGTRLTVLVQESTNMLGCSQSSDVD